MDKIELEFYTNSYNSTFDGERSGSTAQAKSYRMRRIREQGEGQWLDLLWSGVIGEWTESGLRSTS